MKLVGNNSIPLEQLRIDLRKKTLLIPNHQRDDRWEESKKNKWFEDIRNGGLLPGVIMIYTTKGSPIKFINDGAQRIYHSLNKFEEQFKNDSKEILYGANITVQELEYESEQEAIQHFLNMNIGSLATPHEMIKCLFVSQIENYKNVWEPYFKEIHSIIEDLITRLGGRNKKNITEIHKQTRDSLGQFYSFISKNSQDYSPAVSYLNKFDMHDKKQSRIENGLIDFIKKTSYDEMNKLKASFKKFVDEQGAVYETNWNKLVKTKIAPSTAHIRWWLLSSIYRKNKNGDFNKFKTFTYMLIEKTHGKTAIYYKDGNGEMCNSNTAMGRVSNIESICQYLNCDLFCEAKPKRKRGAKTKPGYVNSHIIPYSTDGNNKTITEDASTNRFRGNRDMTKEEYTFLVDYTDK